MIRVADRQALLRLLPPESVGSEIGVWRGDFAADMLRIVRPRLLYLIDHWEYKVGGIPGPQARRLCRDALLPEIVAGRVRILDGASVPMLAALPGHSLDWAYIDADHSYEHVKADLAAAVRVLKPGGWLMGHDYCWLFPGVAQAVDEFCREHRLTIAVMTNQQPEPCCGSSVALNSFAIRMP